ncbi:hypothetical protein D3C80_1522440 [compost metagenome]
MRLGGDQLTDRIIGRSPQRPTGRIGRCAQQAARGAIGEGRLAAALDTAQQPGVMQTSPVQGVQKGFLGGDVRDQVEPVARVFAHSNRSETALHRRSETASSSPVASITTQRSG